MGNTRPTTAIDVPADARGTLLFGGTFDPPHAAHVELAIAARDLAMGEGAWLVLVPAARSPHKHDGPEASDAQRVEMLRLALAGAERTSIWTDEIDRAKGGEATYWIDTLERARSALGASCALRFLIGADQAAAFHRWRSFREIIAIATPVVMPRGEIVSAESLVSAMRESGAWSDDELKAWHSWVAPTPVVPMSATAVRERVRHGDRLERSPPADVHPAVAAYITEHGLYGAGEGT